MRGTEKKYLNIGTMISQTPGVCGGRPCIDGRRITVRMIAGLFNRGLNAEQIAEGFDALTTAQVHAAIAYYLANKKALNAEFKRQEKDEERIVRAALSKTRRPGASALVS